MLQNNIPLSSVFDLLRRVRCQTNVPLATGQVGLLKAGGKALRGLFVTQPGHDHALVARGPVGRRRHLVLSRQLE